MKMGEKSEKTSQRLIRFNKINNKKPSGFLPFSMIIHDEENKSLYNSRTRLYMNNSHNYLMLTKGQTTHAYKKK